MQVFLSWEEIGLQQENEYLWESYTLNIRSCFKNPKDKEDHLIWYLKATRHHKFDFHVPKGVIYVMHSLMVLHMWDPHLSSNFDKLLVFPS